MAHHSARSVSVLNNVRLRPFEYLLSGIIAGERPRLSRGLHALAVPSRQRKGLGSRPFQLARCRDQMMVDPVSAGQCPAIHRNSAEPLMEAGSRWAATATGILSRPCREWGIENIPQGWSGRRDVQAAAVAV